MYLTKEDRQIAFDGFKDVKLLLSTSGNIPEACKIALFRRIDDIFELCERNVLYKFVKREKTKLFLYIQALYDAGFINLNLYHDIDSNLTKAIKKANEIYIKQYKEMGSKKECNKYYKAIEI